MNRSAAFALAVALPLALALTPVAAADPPEPGTRLVVVATGEIARTPDLATVEAGVVTQAPTAARALADAARAMATTLAAIRRAGVGDRDIQTSAVSLNPQYRFTQGQPQVLTGYQVSNQVTVRLRDMAAAGPVVDALVAAGANQINGPTLSIDKPEAALDEARTKAVAIARARAALYARAAGLNVRRIVTISEGGADQPGYGPPGIVAPLVMRAKAPTAIEPGEQTLGVTLTVTFELG